MAEEKPTTLIDWLGQEVKKDFGPDARVAFLPPGSPGDRITQAIEGGGGTVWAGENAFKLMSPQTVSEEKFAELYKQGLNPYDPANRDKFTEGGSFIDGNFKMTPAQIQSIDETAQWVVSYAEKKGVDINSFKDVQAARGFDTDRKALSTRELGSLLYASSMYTAFGPDGLEARGSGAVADGIQHLDVVKALGQQLFGDNNPDSSENTLKDNSPSMKTIRSKPDEIMRC